MITEENLSSCYMSNLSFFNKYTQTDKNNKNNIIFIKIKFIYLKEYLINFLNLFQKLMKQLIMKFYCWI